MATVLITGGTGSFGQAMVRHLLDTTSHDIRVFSRDEQKQDRMKREIGDARVRYLLGDVRDAPRVRRALRGCDYVVHAAALKIIPAGEYNPDEVIKTNVLGSHNVVEACIDEGVRHLVCISSDKAVAPVNLYGNTKACMERLATLANQSSGNTNVSVVRYGNVIGSRGSILTILKDQAASGSLRITHPDMTRFWITLQEACVFVMRVMDQPDGGHIYVPPMRSCRVIDLCTYLYADVPIVYTGMRNGEKMHEWLTNEYEVIEDIGWAYRVDVARWAAGSKPISSADTLVMVEELLGIGGMLEQVRAAAV